MFSFIFPQEISKAVAKNIFAEATKIEGKKTNIGFLNLGILGVYSGVGTVY